MPPHPTFYVKREVYERYGAFDTSLTSVADYELMLRFMYKHRISAAYNEEVMVYMKTGGHSNASLLSHVTGNMEDRKAWVKNNLRSLFFTTLIKPIRKVPQFLFAR